MGILLLKVALVFYGISSAFFLTYVIRFNERVAGMARYASLIAFVVHLAAIAEWMGDLGPQRLTQIYALLPLAAALMVAAYLLMDRRLKLPVLGAFVAPLASVALLLCLVAHPEVRPVGRTVKGFLLPVHISLAFMGVVALALACGVAILYLLLEFQLKHKRFGRIYHRFPSLTVLDQVNYRCVTVGFPIYTVGLILGGLWANRLLSFDAWRPEWVLALLSWVLFGVLLQARLMAGWRGRRAAVLTIAGFGAVLGVLVQYMVRGT